jgi:hypothetical protein
MRAAEVFGTKCETVSYLAPATLYMLSARSTPESIVGEVVGMLAPEVIHAELIVGLVWTSVMSIDGVMVMVAQLGRAA